MPREVSKSWTYTQQAWNSCARTPVASAIESTIGGDDKSVTFCLFGDGSKSKAKKKQTLRLELPDTFDAQAHKVGALVNHFTCHDTSDKCYNDPVQYTPSPNELEQINAVLVQAVADAGSSNLSSLGIYRKCIVAGGLLGEYRGSEWEKWFIAQLDRILLESSLSLPPPSSSKADPIAGAVNVRKHLHKQGIHDPAMVRFVVDLSALAGHNRSPCALVEQWIKVLTTCSSHWCPPQLWWCVATTLVGTNLDGMTRPCKESRVPIPSTLLQNWDMLSLLQLLESHAFAQKVRMAVRRVQQYVRTDLAHERFDADWVRDCECMAELLESLVRPRAAAKLRAFCGRRKHTTDGGERHCCTCDVVYVFIVVGFPKFIVPCTGILLVMTLIQVGKQALRS